MVRPIHKNKLAIAIAALVVSPLTFANEIQNPGFENGFDNWSDTDPSALSSVEHSGSKSIKISGDKGKIQQTIKLEANSTYTLTAYVNGSGTVGVDGSGINESSNVDSETWEKTTVEFSTNSDATVAVYGAYLNDEVRFDDFKLIKTGDAPSNPETPESTSSSIQNPGFESGFDGWVDTDPSALSSEKNSGKKSVKVSGSQGKIAQTLSVDTNSTYRLSAYVKGSGTVGVSSTGVNESVNVSTSDWKEKSITFDTNDTNTITIYGTYFNDEARFDDFKLVKVDGEVPIEPELPETLTCTTNDNLTVQSAMDDGSYNEGQGPNKAIDNDYSTESRWSSNGVGKSMVLDLGVVSKVNSLSIDWFKSDSRRAYFEVETSQDNETWTNVLYSGASSLQKGAEDFDLVASDARYVKIIGQGNDINTWNSIIEAIPVGCNDLESPTEPEHGLDPNSPPSGNFELVDWTLSVPVDDNDDGKSDTVKEIELSSGYSFAPYFYTDDKGAMVFMATIKGAKTSDDTSYVRSELREMLRRGNTDYDTKGVNKNNWVFSTAPSEDKSKAGGVDGTLEATLAVNHVTSTGDDDQVGRVIVGQIHANDDEPLRIYYRKLPENSKGSIYFAHEPRTGDEKFYDLIGSRDDEASNPTDGIAIDEEFGYKVQVLGNSLTVSIYREGKDTVSKTIDMSDSGYDDGGQYMYFKAGVYNQNKSGDGDDYAQATFYSLSNKHSGYDY